jgi:hypothetical protein
VIGITNPGCSNSIVGVEFPRASLGRIESNLQGGPVETRKDLPYRANGAEGVNKAFLSIFSVGFCPLGGVVLWHALIFGLGFPVIVVGRYVVGRYRAKP